MSRATLWEGNCSKNAYPTELYINDDTVWLFQGGDNRYGDYVAMHPNEAIDIAFAILRDLAPTLHETLMQLNVDKETKV